ncbi:hypothetical protein AWRIB202_1890 [Oenococcus oeni AWRIB202]|nr:hypothetical protein AWRIB318_466 [Oenococcus oeni AWRIB318]EKP87961.1 hypothetical protein AWRIB202_1890 [Oenococcus oeni AWRIB202]
MILIILKITSKKDTHFCVFFIKKSFFLSYFPCLYYTSGDYFKLFLNILKNN